MKNLSEIQKDLQEVLSSHPSLARRMQNATLRHEQPRSPENVERKLIEELEQNEKRLQDSRNVLTKKMGWNQHHSRFSNAKRRSNYMRY
ncbi:MAG: hypothetical protein MHPSP_002296, partial [Paramarteilia canceri]